jgi:hypothetical protein
MTNQKTMKVVPDSEPPTAISPTIAGVELPHHKISEALRAARSQSIRVRSGEGWCYSPPDKVGAQAVRFRRQKLQADLDRIAAAARIANPDATPEQMA